VTPLEDQMYIALMAAKSFIQPRVRADLRDMGVLNVIEKTIKLYQAQKNPPPGKAEQPMDWDSVREISG
jgi:hypothetical protein